MPTPEINENISTEISNPSSLKGKPLVSVSMITYNHEQYIEEAINGVLMQETDFDVELVISNDNSPDQTDAIIQRIIKEHPNGHWINYIKHEKNLGMMPNSIDNLKQCSGEYIAICEGDDFWTDKHKLQIQINLMQENPQCYLSFHPANEMIGYSLSEKVLANHSAKNKVFTDIEMIRRIGNIFCPTASMILCRKALDPFPKFLTTAPIGDDFLQILSSLNGGALYISRNMSVYRKGHPGSWNTIKNEEKNLLTILDNRINFTFKYMNTLDSMANFIDNKYYSDIEIRKSSLLFSLSISYLENNMNKHFIEVITQSYKVHKPISLLHLVLYYFRFSPYVTKKILELHSQSFFRIICSYLKKIINV